MKKHYPGIVILTGLLIAVLCSSGLNKMYVQAHGELGWVFHIFSQKLPTATNGQGPKSIDFDYTYVEKTDSVAILCTVRLSESERINDFQIGYCDAPGISETQPELVYVQSWKKGIEYRMRTYVPFAVWEQMYGCQTPFTMSFHVSCANNEENPSYSFSYSGKKWDKHRDTMIAIMNIIKLNTGKNEENI